MMRGYRFTFSPFAVHAVADFGATTGDDDIRKIHKTFQPVFPGGHPGLSVTRLPPASRIETERTMTKRGLIASWMALFLSIDSCSTDAGDGDEYGDAAIDAARAGQGDAGIAEADQKDATGGDAATDAGAIGDAAEGDAVNAETGTRSFYLAAAPMQYDMGVDHIETVFDVAGFEGLADLVSMHQDFFGVPWEAFAAGDEPSAGWADSMRSMKESIDAIGAGVYLSITPLNGRRNSIAPRVRTENGETVTEENWVEGCVDFGAPLQGIELAKAYSAYARWMVDLFEPVFLTNLIEMNIYDIKCPERYDSLIGLANQVYDQEKAIDPELPIFPSFTIGTMWGIETIERCQVGDRTCLQQALERNAGVKRDRFGISFYPLFLQWKWTGIPDDFFSAVNEITSERIVWAETGWGNRSVTLPYPAPTDPCMTLLESSDADQIAFLQFLLEDAQRLNSDLISWWSARDSLPDHVLTGCPCSSPGLWCVLYDALADAELLGAWLMWGAMGVLDYEHRPKASHAIWTDWKARTIE